jgi:hypothetical protein
MVSDAEYFYKLILNSATETMRLRYLFMLIVMPLLCGCSGPAQLYIVNKTKDATKVEIYYSQRYLDYFDTTIYNKKNPRYVFTSNTVKIRLDVYKRFKETLSGIRSENKVTIEVPPATTCFLEHGSNMSFWGVEKVLVYEKDTTIEFKHYLPGVHHYRRGGLGYAVWYTVEAKPKAI